MAFCYSSPKLTKKGSEYNLVMGKKGDAFLSKSNNQGWRGKTSLGDWKV